MPHADAADVAGSSTPHCVRFSFFRLVLGRSLTACFDDSTIGASDAVGW